VTHSQFEVLSNQAVAACGIVYFLAVMAHMAQWAAGRRVEEPVEERVPVGSTVPAVSSGGSGASGSSGSSAAAESERMVLLGPIGL
jgi:hypothetical protein